MEIHQYLRCLMFVSGILMLMLMFLLSATGTVIMWATDVFENLVLKVSYLNLILKRFLPGKKKTKHSLHKTHQQLSKIPRALFLQKVKCLLHVIQGAEENLRTVENYALSVVVHVHFFL